MSATVPCMSRFTTVKGEHWCSIVVGIDHAARSYASTAQIAHEGPCVEITERWGAVENTIWAAMASNAHLIRPADEVAERENELCPPVCAHGKTADRGCLESPCGWNADSAHPIALRLDADRTNYLTKVATEDCATGTGDIHRTPVVQIHTGGELHPVPRMSVPTFIFNLSRLLDDPARKPDADLVKRDGTDHRMQDFVFFTEGALDLYEDMVNMISRQLKRGKDVTVLILCRGGKHRSVAFGENLAGHFDVTATHHHVHLPRVVTTKPEGVNMGDGKEDAGTKDAREELEKEIEKLEREQGK